MFFVLYFDTVPFFKSFFFLYFCFLPFRFLSFFLSFFLFFSFFLSFFLSKCFRRIAEFFFLSSYSSYFLNLFHSFFIHMYIKFLFPFRFLSFLFSFCPFSFIRFFFFRHALFLCSLLLTFSSLCLFFFHWDCSFHRFKLREKCLLIQIVYLSHTSFISALIFALSFLFTFLYVLYVLLINQMTFPFFCTFIIIFSFFEKKPSTALYILKAFCTESLNKKERTWRWVVRNESITYLKEIWFILTFRTMK